jgi:hypothetical protein
MRLSIGLLSLAALLWLGVWGLRRFTAARAVGTGATGTSAEDRAEDLFAPGDKPLTVLLKGVSEETGQVVTFPTVIRQSRSRLNQMKQVVRAVLGTRREGRVRVPGTPRMSLNGVFLAPDGTAVVDLSVEPDPEFGFWEETLFVRGLVYALSNHFPEVKRVRLLMDGQESGTLAGHYALGSPAGSYARNAGETPAD